MLKVTIWVCNDDDSSPQVYSSWIFITLPRGNVTLQIAIGPFVNMTFESRPSCGKIGPFVGLEYEIGQFVGIGPVVGIGQFGGTGPVVSLTNIHVLLKFKHFHSGARWPGG